ncbi:hypothetical protein HMPREF9136_1454 [Prevotella dentalis DSM 3688]|uniref:Uncharacterized protein n=1 Tax=Prevotella dentalis (strain ATCC 49559 / DSM 3688 / JCM 13448 / NCTC 12043 / ES 2772) TaxID=908937 RepID=F9D3M6_PREDD|nr:hypothetical protein HMPREF9136_1454 [Prevotella dentalis DSM 3688]
MSFSRGRNAQSVVLDESTAVNAHFPLSWTNFPREMFTSRFLWVDKDNG